MTAKKFEESEGAYTLTLRNSRWFWTFRGFPAEDTTYAAETREMLRQYRKVAVTTGGADEGLPMALFAMPSALTKCPFFKKGTYHFLEKTVSVTRGELILEPIPDRPRESEYYNIGIVETPMYKWVFWDFIPEEKLK